MKKSIIAALICLAWVSCNDQETAGSSGTVTPPSDVTVEQTGTAEVTMTWTDNSDNETGFGIYFYKASEVDAKEQIALLDPNVTEFVLNEGIEIGVNYYLGVQAKGETSEYDSRIISVLFKLEEEVVVETASPVIESIESNDVCISVRYRIDDYKSGTEYGLCWSAAGEPTIEDSFQIGPQSDRGASMLQVIPNSALSYGTSYTVRAYATTSSVTVYSESHTVSLGTEPSEIVLTWQKCTFSGLPSDIEVYETTDKLNGDNFHAWYAIADVSAGNVELRVLLPDTAATIDAQAEAADGCYVLVNGGYFYNGSHTGLAVLEGVPNGTISAVRGSLLTDDDEYNVMYNVTRGIFGTDASGNPAVYWAGMDASSNVYYFNSPLPSVVGEAKYDAVSSTNPSSLVSWSPNYALSAGPVLLYDGKCPFDFTETVSGSGYYLSNYEVIAYDIFGTSVTPDRTAVGYTQDGKIILFICDGRITDSGGATLVELAAIMKGLGCVGAVNFDGGGSTGMVVCGDHVNDLTGGNRAVVSTIGFFRK